MPSNAERWVKNNSRHSQSSEKIDKGGGTCLLGAHFSIARGLHNAVYEAHAYGCNALQIFTKNANTWKERKLSQNEINRFARAMEHTGITAIAAHTSYLINLATDEKTKHAMSCEALTNELIRSSKLDIPFVVLHPGSHMGNGALKGMKKVIGSINTIFANTPYVTAKLLLETTAGQGSSLGQTFEQLATIMDKVENKPRLGVCLDTSHIFAAGYDIRTKTSYDQTMTAFDTIVGLTHLDLIHLNDSKKKLGSRVDRHEHIGDGYIGLEAFKLFMNDERFKNTPKIIETPKSNEREDSDMINLTRLRGLLMASQ